MFLTVNDNGNDETFKDCFDYLMEVLPTHALLNGDERETCRESIEKLKGVFRRFYEKTS